MKKFIWLVLVIAIVVLLVKLVYRSGKTTKNSVQKIADSTAIWTAPQVDSLPAGPETDLIIYGKELIANTSFTWDRGER